MTPAYKSIGVPGVFLGEETYYTFKPLQRALIMVRYTLPTADTVMEYVRTQAARVLEHPDFEPECVSEAILKHLPEDVVQELRSGDKYTDTIRGNSPDYSSATNTPLAQILQTRISIFSLETAEALQRELRTGRDYNHAHARKEVAEGGRILIPLQNWELPLRAKMRQLLDDRVRQSDPLTILSNYPYAETRGMIEAIYDLHDQGRGSLTYLEDISPDLVRQYAGEGLEKIHAAVAHEAVLAAVRNARVVVLGSGEEQVGSPFRPPGKNPKDYGPN